MTGWPSAYQKPRKFLNGDQVKIKARYLKTRWGKQHVGKAYTVVDSMWEPMTYDLNTDTHIFAWEITCVDWAEPEYPWSIAQEYLTRVRIAK